MLCSLSTTLIFSTQRVLNTLYLANSRIITFEFLCKTIYHHLLTQTHNFVTNLHRTSFSFYTIYNCLRKEKTLGLSAIYIEPFFDTTNKCY